MKVARVIISYDKFSDIEGIAIVGVYSTDTVEEGLNEVKRQMKEKGIELQSEKRDCCDCTLSFILPDGSLRFFETKGYIIDETNIPSI